MTKTYLLAATSALVALTSPAAAHRAWLVPSITTLSDTTSWVTVDAAVSNDLFYADHFPLGTEQVKVWQPDGTPGQIQNVAKGRYRSVFDVAIDKPGTWRVGMMDSNVGGTFKVNGEDWAVGRRRGPPGGGPGGPGGPGGANPPRPPAAAKPAGPEGAEEGGGPRRPTIAPDHMVATVADIPATATDLNLTESISRNEFYVSAGSPTTAIFAPTNKGLEMVPVTHPDELVSNEPGRFRFLIDGKPAADLKVTLVPGGKRYRAGEEAQTLTTAADGILTVKWPVAGMYWLNTSAADDHPGAPRATHRRMSYTATLEVVAP